MGRVSDHTSKEALAWFAGSDPEDSTRKATTLWFSLSLVGPEDGSNLQQEPDAEQQIEAAAAAGGWKPAGFRYWRRDSSEF